MDASGIVVAPLNNFLYNLNPENLAQVRRIQSLFLVSLSFCLSLSFFLS